MPNLEDCSNKVIGFIEAAREEALQSNMQEQMGSVVVVGGKICSVGHNYNERTMFYGDVYCSCHAEMDALHGFFSGRNKRELKGCLLQEQQAKRQCKQQAKRQCKQQAKRQCEQQAKRQCKQQAKCPCE